MLNLSQGSKHVLLLQDPKRLLNRRKRERASAGAPKRERERQEHFDSVQELRVLRNRYEHLHERLANLEKKFLVLLGVMRTLEVTKQQSQSVEDRCILKAIQGVKH